MNYVAHLDILIGRARNRILVGYRERHHVIPRCLGGTDEQSNIVELTAREHYIAHQLLVKIHPGAKGLVWAAIRQARNAPNSRAYSWLKKKQAVFIGNARRGGKISEWHKERLLSSRRGTKNSPEHREKIAASLKGIPLSVERRAKIGAAHLGKKRAPLSPEHRAKIGLAGIGKKYRLGKKHSAAAREKMSAAMRECWAARRAA